MWWLLVALQLTLYAWCIEALEVNVTLAVQQYFHSGCVILLSPTESSGSERIQEMVKTFSARQVQVAVQPFNISGQPRQRECQRNKPLHVLLNSHHLTKLPLAQADGIWLIFLKAGQDLNEFLEDVHIPVDCEFLVARFNGSDFLHISEVYRMAPRHPLYCTQFGFWQSDQGLRAPTHSLVKRRSNFHGHNITATSMNFPPLMLMNKNRAVGGLFGVVWRILEKRLNFNTVYVEPEQKTWGALLPNNTTTGMVAMLHSGKVEVAVFNMLMTSRRMLAIDFTKPLLSPSYHIFIRKSDQLSLKWNTYLAPFSRRLWFAVIFLILVISLFLPGLYCLGRRHGLAEPKLVHFRIRDSLFVVFGAFCQQGIEQACPQLSSCRVVYMTTYFTSVILLASYSGTLVSFLTVRTVSLPFNDLEDVLHAGTHKLGAVNTSTMLYHFRNAPSGLYHRVYNSLLDEKHDSLVGNVRSGLLRVCEEKFLLMALNAEVLAHLSSVHCPITTLPVSYFQSSLSYGLRLNSAYKPFFNYHLQCLVDNGVLHKLRQRLSTPFHIHETDSIESLSGPISVPIEHLFPILIALGVGIVLGMAFLCLEKLTRRKWRRDYRSTAHCEFC